MPERRAIELKRAAALRVVVERNLQDMADLERIAADQVAPELFDLRGDGAVAIVLAVGFSPSDDAGIGFEADEHEILPPAGMDRQALNACNLHCNLGYVSLRFMAFHGGHSKH